jgi:hypothetical protein
MNCIPWSRLLSVIWEKQPESKLEDWLSRYSAELRGPEFDMRIDKWSIYFETTEDMLIFKLTYNV